MTTGLFLLRCLETGISIADLDLLTVGMILDCWIEKGNDAWYADNRTVIASQEQMDAF